MALAPLTPSTKPIKSTGLFDAAKAGGQTFEAWSAANPGSDAMPSIAPAQVNDSMADKVTALSSQDSKLNQMARTEGLKAANRRGLLNSSMAVGASQDAVLKNVLPIASQDSAQDFARNQAGRAFEFSMAGQNDAQQFQRGEAGLDRALQESMQNKSLTAAEQAQIRDIGFRTGQNALDRQLQQTIANLNVGAEEKRSVAGYISGMEDIYRSTVQSIMANTNLSAEQREQQLSAAKALRDRQLDFAQQIWSVQLDWGQPGSPTATTPATTPAPAGTAGGDTGTTGMNRIEAAFAARRR